MPPPNRLAVSNCSSTSKYFDGHTHVVLARYLTFAERLLNVSVRVLVRPEDAVRILTNEPLKPTLIVEVKAAHVPIDEGRDQVVSDVAPVVCHSRYLYLATNRPTQSPSLWPTA